jgi:hypothetical protein
MTTLQDLWRPLVSQLTWSVRRGVGSFLTMEFGEPHLSIREPIPPQFQSSTRVQRNLRRRRVFIVGDCHFWVQYGAWKLSTATGVLDSQSPIGSPLEECLNDLDGQRLVSMRLDPAGEAWTLEFDQEGLLEIKKSEGNDEPQWSLHQWNGDVAESRRDRILHFDRDAYAAAGADEG